MKKGINWWRADCCRVFSSKAFWISIFLFPLCDLLSLYSEDFHNLNVISMFYDAMNLGFVMAYFVIYTIPFSHSYCSDKNNHFIRYQVIRGNLRKYVASKVLFCALGSGFATLAGKALTIGMLALKFPFYDKAILMEDSMDVLSVSIREGKIVQIVIAMLLLVMLEGAFYGVIAFTVSTFLTNPFLIAASPILFRQFFMEAMFWIPDEIYFRYFSLIGIFSIRWSKFPTIGSAVLYAFAFVGIGIVLMLLLSYKRIKRGFENG